MDSLAHHPGRARRRGTGLCPKRPGKEAKQRCNTTYPPSLHSAERVAEETALMTESWAAGYSRLPDMNRHATLWRNGALTDLNTLGGPNSSITWNVKNTVASSWVFPKLSRRSPSANPGVARLSTVRLTTSAISISDSSGNRPDEGTCPIFRVEIMALPPEPITEARWSGGRRMGS